MYSFAMLLALSGSCDAFGPRKKSSTRKDTTRKDTNRKKTTKESQDNFKDIRTGFLAEIKKYENPVVVLVLEELLRFNVTDASALPAELRNELNTVNQALEGLSAEEQNEIILSYIKRIIPYYSCVDSRFMRLLTEAQNNNAQLLLITHHHVACSEELFERLRQDGLYMQPLSFTEENDLTFDLGNTTAHYKNGILFAETPETVRDAFEALIEASPRAVSISPILLGSAAFLLGVSTAPTE